MATQVMTNREIQLLYASLYACTRSGGGSENWSLCRKLKETFPSILSDEDALLELVCEQQTIAAKEFLEGNGFNLAGNRPATFVIGG